MSLELKRDQSCHIKCYQSLKRLIHMEHSADGLNGPCKTIACLANEV